MLIGPMLATRPLRRSTTSPRPLAVPEDSKARLSPKPPLEVRKKWMAGLEEVPMRRTVATERTSSSVETSGAGGAAFRQALLEVYVPRYGPEWETFLDSGPIYARIEADRMFAFAMPAA